MVAFETAALWQNSAHSKHAMAHCRQWSMCSCCRHSSPHAPHISAHTRQVRSAKSELRASILTVIWQMSAQSWSSWIHRANIFTSSSCIQDDAQCKQATAHLLQASIISWYFWCGIMAFRLIQNCNEPVREKFLIRELICVISYPVIITNILFWRGRQYLFNICLSPEWELFHIAGH